MFCSFSSCLVRTVPSSFRSLLIKFFRFRWRACEWKRAVLVSPSLSQVIRERLRAMVRCNDERARQWCLSLFRNQSSSLERDRWSCAISSWWSTSLASASRELTCPTVFWLQLWRCLTVALSFLANVSKGQWEVGSEAQADATTSWKPSSLVQKDSKWNLALPGCMLIGY